MRRPRMSLGLAITLAVAGAVSVPSATAADPSFSATAGTEYTSGDYGGDQSIDEFYVPVSFLADFEKVSVRLTVPFLSVRAPEYTVIDGPDGVPIAGEGPAVTSSGLGDVLVAVTVYDALVSRQGNFALDLTGKVKFGTASASDGLGTGEEDYSLQVDAFRFFERLTALGTAGYSMRGDPADYDLRDTFYGSLGASYRLRDRTSLGVFYDFREASLDGVDASQELSCSVTTALGHSGRIDFYLLGGFGSSSPDWGVGLTMRAAF